MIIRTAKIDDLKCLTEIYNQAIAAGGKTADTIPFSVNERKSWFINHPPDKHPIYVAETDGKVSGYITISPYRAGREALRFTAEVSYYVDFGHHGKGIGTALMEHVLNKCPDLGIRNLFAILLETNKASIALLEKFEFTKWAHLPLVASFNDKEVGQLYYGRRIEQS